MEYNVDSWNHERTELVILRKRGRKRGGDSSLAIQTSNMK